MVYQSAERVNAIAEDIKAAIPMEVVEDVQDYALLPRLNMLFSMPLASRETQLKYSWNPNDCSRNIFVRPDDQLTFHRRGAISSTDCIRGKVGFTRGTHCWEIVWPMDQRGTCPIVGVATSYVPLHGFGYRNVVGSTNASWGWNLHDKKLYHNSRHKAAVAYPALRQPDESFVVPDRFYVVLDMDQGTLGFMVDGKYLGVAFRGLKGKTLYPIANAVWGHCNVTMRYIGGIGQPLSLLDLCCSVVQNSLGEQNLEDKAMSLQIPEILQMHLMYRNRIY